MLSLYEAVNSKVVGLAPGQVKCRYCGYDGKVSKSDNLYWFQTESNPKCYCQIMGGTDAYIGYVEADPWKLSGQSSIASIFGGKNEQWKIGMKTQIHLDKYVIIIFSTVCAVIISEPNGSIIFYCLYQIKLVYIPQCR
jgi:hypothetical protein